jgi:hypothetical protein
MKNKLSAILVLLVLTACAGLTARQEVLLPALQMAWPGVSESVTAGIESGRTTERLTDPEAAMLAGARDATSVALDSGDAAALAVVPWLPLRDEANAGIAHRIAEGEISTGVGESLKERVRQFTEARATFLSGR